MRLLNATWLYTLCFLLTATGFWASPACAQLSTVEAQRLGMEVLWRSNVQMPFEGRGVASSNLWVSSENPREYAVVKLENRTFRVSAEQMDRKGNALGLEGATELVREQAARFLGKQDGFQVEQVSVPRIHLVVVTADGLVQNFDAETGMLQWSNSCGPLNAPTFPAALSAEGVAVLQGNRFYLLDWNTGKQRVSRELRSKTSNAIAVSSKVAFVSDFNGVVTTYGVGDPIRPWQYVIQGRAVGQPVSFDDQSFCAISSEDGFTYVFTGGDDQRPEVWIRYETSSAISGSLAAGNNAFYVGTVGGSLSKISVQQRLGAIAWEHRTSSPITAPALVAGKAVYVATESGTLLSLADDNSGLANWIKAGFAVRQVVGVSGKHVICTTKSNQLAAFDADTGSLVYQTQPILLATPIVNAKSDRVYVLDNIGRLQCLRPIGSELPKMTVPFVPAENSEDGTGSGGPADNENIFAAPAAQDAVPGDIFGANPFGGDDAGNAADGGDVNPFGDADPFK